MSKSNDYENDLQRFTFNNVSPTGIGTSLFVALHTADPGEAGDQTTSECAYPGYARVGVNRNGTGWSVTGSNASNVNEILFPTATGGSETATHMSIGVNASGASKILYKGALVSSLAISNNIAPRFVASTGVTVSED